jgi:hypothetical protein
MIAKTVTTSTDVLFSSGPSISMRLQREPARTKAARKRRSLAELKREIESLGPGSVERAEANARKLIGRSRI